MQSISDAARSMKDGVANAVKGMGESITNSKFGKALQKLGEIAKTVGNAIANAFKTLFSWLSERFGEIKFDTILDIFNTGLLGALALSIKKFLDGAGKPVEAVTEIIKEGKSILKGVKGILDEVRGCFEARI